MTAQNPEAEYLRSALEDARRELADVKDESNYRYETLGKYMYRTTNLEIDHSVALQAIGAALAAFDFYLDLHAAKRPTEWVDEYVKGTILPHLKTLYEPERKRVNEVLVRKELQLQRKIEAEHLKGK